MYSNLNSRTRRIIEELVVGGSPTVGGQVVAGLTENQRRLLHVLATKSASLSRGGDLVTQIENELAGASPLPTNVDLPVPLAANTNILWRFGKVRAQSFRGLAPAGHIWTYDFGGKSHLMYGPNGCGKSSLMGAVAWTLTGRLFRDDCDPCTPEEIDVFTTDAKAKSAGTRPCALALTDEAGVNTATDAAYWVELELLPCEGSSRSTPIWIRRHRSDGLSTSDDGGSWRNIGGVDAVGISELDTELHVLMPARVPHLSFGKVPELVRLFAQVVGLDDLEAIGDSAKSVHAAFSRVSSAIHKNLAPLRGGVTELIAEFEKLCPTGRHMPHAAGSTTRRTLPVGIAGRPAHPRGD